MRDTAMNDLGNEMTETELANHILLKKIASRRLCVEDDSCESSETPRGGGDNGA